jgi:hypothetical protein
MLLARVIATSVSHIDRERAVIQFAAIGRRGVASLALLRVANCASVVSGCERLRAVEAGDSFGGRTVGDPLAAEHLAPAAG